MGQYLSLFFGRSMTVSSTTASASVTDMPQELSFLVMEYLSIKDLFIIQRVNHCHWYELFRTWLWNQEALVFERHVIGCNVTGGNVITDECFFRFVSFLDQALQDYKSQNTNITNIDQNDPQPFKFVNLKRVTLVQSVNLQNNNTLISHFKLPLTKKHPAGGFCYNVGRSAVSIDFQTSSMHIIESKQKSKQRFAFDFTANTSISKRRVGHLSLYGNYVHYHYNPQFDTNNTTHSTFVNAGSIMGAVEQTALIYQYDKSYCTTIFVDDNCYRVFVDEEEYNVIQSRFNEIKRHKEKCFKFKHTVNSNVLCDVLDQFTITHNKDVISISDLSFHHIPSWVNKTELFSEHSFTVNSSPESTFVVHRNVLCTMEEDNGSHKTLD